MPALGDHADGVSQNWAFCARRLVPQWRRLTETESAFGVLITALASPARLLKVVPIGRFEATATVSTSLS